MKHPLTRRQGQRRRARAVDYSHDERLAAAVVEEMFDGIPEWTGLPETPEHLLKFREARDEYRAVHRTAQRTADESGARRAEPRDGLIGTALFLDLYA